jgi:hypothetical protein
MIKIILHKYCIIIAGILLTTNGVYNTTPWQNLTLDKAGTFMAFYAVVVGPGTFAYSAQHEQQLANFSAICEYGE